MTLGEDLRYESEQARAIAVQMDQEALDRPTPGANQSHYSGDAERQMAISASGDKNEITAAHELGLTSEQWKALRRKIGKSPVLADVVAHGLDRH